MSCMFNEKVNLRRLFENISSDVLIGGGLFVLNEQTMLIYGLKFSLYGCMLVRFRL